MLEIFYCFKPFVRRISSLTKPSVLTYIRVLLDLIMMKDFVESNVCSLNRHHKTDFVGTLLRKDTNPFLKSIIPIVRSLICTMFRVFIDIQIA